MRRARAASTGTAARRCAGGDPKDFQAAQKMMDEGRAEDNSKGAQEFANRLKYVNECPVPVIA